MKTKTIHEKLDEILQKLDKLEMDKKEYSYKGDWYEIKDRCGQCGRQKKGIHSCYVYEYENKNG